MAIFNHGFGVEISASREMIFSSYTTTLVMEVSRYSRLSKTLGDRELNSGQSNSVKLYKKWKEKILAEREKPRVEVEVKPKYHENVG